MIILASLHVGLWNMYWSEMKLPDIHIGTVAVGWWWGCRSSVFMENSKIIVKSVCVNKKLKGLFRHTDQGMSLNWHRYGRIFFCIECVVKNGICPCISLTTCILRDILLLDVLIDIMFCFYSVFHQPS